MVGKTDRESIRRDLAVFGGPRPRRLDDLDAAGEKVVDGARCGGAAQVEALGELVEDADLVGAEVEVAAEDERAIAGPGNGPLGRGPDLLRRECANRARVEVRHADFRGGADEAHGPPLGPPPQNQVAGLDRLRPELMPQQDRVRSTLPAGQEIRISASDDRLQRRQPVARCEGPTDLGIAGFGQAVGPPRWAFLKQGDVPAGAREHRRELVEQLAVNLEVSLVPLRGAEEPRPGGAERGVGGKVAAVEEVPAQHHDLHRTSIAGTTRVAATAAYHHRLLVTRNFLTGEELTRDELEALLDRALELKAGRDRGEGAAALRGRSVALLFEKPSTRTRVSFEVGVAELGGIPVVLRGDELQLARGESVGDTARILSGYVHAIVVRAGSHALVTELADAAGVPVINGLTPEHHPCQALADLLTLRERFGELDGLALAYVGDGNNVARSLGIMGRTAGVEVRVGSPSGYGLEPGLASLDTSDPREAVDGADAVYTDVWVSMGDEAEAERRRADLAPYQLNAALLASAKDRAVALHCLPAHAGEEITEEVLYSERSAVWDQAENRLHAQKALLELLVPSA